LVLSSLIKTITGDLALASRGLDKRRRNKGLQKSAALLIGTAYRPFPWSSKCYSKKKRGAPLGNRQTEKQKRRGK